MRLLMAVMLLLAVATGCQPSDSNLEPSPTTTPPADPGSGGGAGGGPGPLPARCDDGKRGTTDSYDAATDTCSNIPTPGFCDDGKRGTTDSYNPAADTCSNIPTPGFCDDGKRGTTDSYNPAADTCASVPIPGYCDDGNPATIDGYDLATDTCAHVPAPPPVAWYVPPATATWQWQLSGTVNTGYTVSVYDIDLFDSPALLVANLQAGGKRVVCYFSAGSYEDWRPDAAAFQAADLGNPLSGWPGERWLDVRAANVRRIMAARLDLALQKGCDAVEPDNVDGYTNSTGLPFTAADQLAYNRYLAAEAHARGLGIALKNDLDQVAALVDAFDFAVNEQCHQYNECGLLRPFTSAGKAVFNAEYNSQYVNDPARRAQLCADAIAAGLRTLVLPVNLNDAFRYSCD